MRHPFPRPRARATVVAVVALAVSLGAVACGGGGAGPAAVEHAYERTIAGGTAHFTVDAAASAAGQSIAQSGQGTVDFGGRKVETTSTRASASDSRSDGSPAATPDRQIVIGDDVWLSVPASLVKTVPGAKPFAHSTLQAESADVTTALSRPPNPAQLLGELRGLDRSTVKRMGSAKLRGAATTHFAATVDLAAGAGADAAAAATAAGVAQLTGSSRVPVEVWVDKPGRVRRLEVQLKHLRLTAPSGGGGLTLDVTLTTELFDFGTAAVITPPPPDQVMDARELQGP